MVISSGCDDDGRNGDAPLWLCRRISQPTTPPYRSYYSRKTIMTSFEAKATPTTPVSIVDIAIIGEQLLPADELRRICTKAYAAQPTSKLSSNAASSQLPRSTATLSHARSTLSLPSSSAIWAVQWMQLTAALALGLNSHTVGCIRVWVQEHSCLRRLSTGTYVTKQRGRFERRR